MLDPSPRTRSDGRARRGARIDLGSRLGASVVVARAAAARTTRLAVGKGRIKFLAAASRNPAAGLGENQGNQGLGAGEKGMMRASAARNGSSRRPPPSAASAAPAEDAKRGANLRRLPRFAPPFKSPMRVGILLNPNSRKNRKQAGTPESIARVAKLSARVGSLGEVVETQDIDELKAAIRRLLGQGVEYLVSDGGDGALHWALNEVRAERGDDHLVPLVPTCGGTIDFVARKVGVSGTQDAIVERLLRNLERGNALQITWLDSLRIQGTYAADGQDEDFDRLGFALAAGGVGQRFFDHYYASDDPRAATIVSIVLT